MDNEIFDIIISEYENQRAKNKREREERVNDVYKKLPEIREIDEKIAETGKSSLRAIFNNPDDLSIKEEMKRNLRILDERKREILEKNNISPDFDKEKYKCLLCKDTGHIEGNGRCSCFKQKMIDYLYEQSNMKELLKTHNFNNFNMDFYSDKSVKGMNRTPYENIKNIKSFCEDFVDKFDKPSKNLAFYGDTGLGKTFMSSCIAKALMDKGKTVLYIRASKLFKMFDDEKFGRLSDNMDLIYKSDLLIVDDLGTEPASKNNNSYILDLINERVSSGKKMIISTNLDYKNLEDKYTKRFSSRLLESFEFMYFYGEDIRRIKLFNKGTVKNV